jgi:hypothetical protein
LSVAESGGDEAGRSGLFAKLRALPDEFVFPGRNCDCKPMGERPVIGLMLSYRRECTFLQTCRYGGRLASRARQEPRPFFRLAGILCRAAEAFPATQRLRARTGPYARKRRLRRSHAQRRDGDWGNWALGRNGIYYIQRRPATDDAEILYRDFTTGRSRSIYVMTKPPIWGGGGLAVSPDEKTLLFAQIDHDGENIFVQ